MRHIILLLGLLAAAPRAWAMPVDDCKAGPPTKLTMETQVRSILVETVASNAPIGVQVSVCIDSVLPGATSARFALMSVTGHLLVIFGQQSGADLSWAHGAVHSYFFSSSDTTFGIDLNKLADHLVVQPVFGNQTYAFLQRASFKGLTPQGFARLASDSCLGAPLPQRAPTLRDVSVITAPDDTNYTVSACVVSPAGGRIAYAGANFHPFHRTKVVDVYRLPDVMPGGDSLPGMHPLVGFPPGGPRTIGLLRVQPTLKPSETMADPYPIMVIEPIINLCLQNPTETCTPDMLFDSATAVRFTFRGKLP